MVKPEIAMPSVRISASSSPSMPLAMFLASACRLNMSLPSLLIQLIRSWSRLAMMRSFTSPTVYVCLMPASFSISTSCAATRQLNAPKARIGIPPGSPGAGRLIAFFVPHFTRSSFVLMKSTSARSGVLKPNLKLFNVVRKGMMSDSIS